MLIVSERTGGWAINFAHVVTIEPRLKSIAFTFVNASNSEDDELVMFCSDPRGVFEQILEAYARGDRIYRLPE